MRSCELRSVGGPEPGDESQLSPEQVRGLSSHHLMAARHHRAKGLVNRGMLGVPPVAPRLKLLKVSDASGSFDVSA